MLQISHQNQGRFSCPRKEGLPSVPYITDSLSPSPQHTPVLLSVTLTKVLANQEQELFTACKLFLTLGFEIIAMIV